MNVRNLSKNNIKSISFEGIGLHSGKNSKVTIIPGKIDQGIIFKRIDLKSKNLVELIMKMYLQQNCVPLWRISMVSKFLQ